MYKRHKIQLGICALTTFVVAFIFDWNFEPMTEASVTVASIAMGVYIAAVSALLGSQYAKELKSITDGEQPDKTLLGVLSEYFRYAGLLCISLIAVSCLFLIPSKINFCPLLLRVGSALSYGLFSDNIFLLLAPGDRDHILSGVFNQFLSANPRASRINKKSANNPALID